MSCVCQDPNCEESLSYQKLSFRISSKKSSLRVARSQKIKRPNLAISSFKKFKFSYVWRPNKDNFSNKTCQNISNNFWNFVNFFHVLLKFSQSRPKKILFFQDWKTAQKGQIILFLQKRPNGNLSSFDCAV